MTPPVVKLVKLIGNLGYGSRKEVARMFREGRVTDGAGEVLYADDAVAHGDVRIDGAPLDPPPGMALLLHKPVGYTCSTRDPGRIVYDLLPPRFRLRAPILSTVGRLDRDTSGALLLTDDGALLLESEETPLAPATLEVLGPRHARLVLTEGRYHQVRRMFAATGNHVETLHRPRIGGLSLGDLAPGQWRLLEPADLQRLFATDEHG